MGSIIGDVRGKWRTERARVGLFPRFPSQSIPFARFTVMLSMVYLSGVMTVSPVYQRRPGRFTACRDIRVCPAARVYHPGSVYRSWFT
jgi:hypothetical protein